MRTTPGTLKRLRKRGGWKPTGTGRESEIEKKDLGRLESENGRSRGIHPGNSPRLENGESHGFWPSPGSDAVRTSIPDSLRFRRLRPQVPWTGNRPASPGGEHYGVDMHRLIETSAHLFTLLRRRASPSPPRSVGKRL